MAIAGDSYGDVSRQELAAEAQRRAGLETALSRMLATANRMGDVRRDDVRYREQLAARELADQENRAYRDRAFRYMQESDLANRWGREDQQAAALEHQNKVLAQQAQLARENQAFYQALNDSSTNAAVQQRADAEVTRRKAELFNLANNMVAAGNEVPELVLRQLDTDQLDVLDAQIGGYNKKVDLASKQNESVASAINARLNAVAPALSPVELEQVTKLQAEIPNMPTWTWFGRGQNQQEGKAELNRLMSREAARAKQASDLLRGSEDLQRRVMYNPGVGFTPVELPRRSALPGVPNRPVERISDLTGPELPPELMTAAPAQAPQQLPPEMMSPQQSGPLPAAPAMNNEAFQALLPAMGFNQRVVALRALREEIAREFGIGPESVGASAIGRSPESVVQRLLSSDPDFVARVNALDPATAARMYQAAIARASQPDAGRDRGVLDRMPFRYMGQ